MYPTYPTYPQSAPYCTISITNQYGYGYGYGSGQATLTWYSTGATSAFINPYVGTVPTSGSRTVTANQMYTMTVWGPGGSATCQTQAQYMTPPPYSPGSPVYAPTYSAPYVSLAQMPYTGFGDLLGSAAAWFAIVVAALGGAYVLIRFKGEDMMAFVGDIAPGLAR